MSNDNINVSVCIATYNGSPFIVSQLQSILVQLDDNSEVLIFDDCSTDDTKEKVNSLNDSRIIFMQQSSRVGIIANFQSALLLAKGKYVFLSDQDDVWLPTKVDKCIAALSDAILVVTDCIVTDSNLNVIHPSFFNMIQSSPGVLKNLYKNSYLGCCIAFRSELLKLSLPIPTGIPMHDMWLGLIANFFDRVEFINTPLLLYRRHKGSASPTGQRSPYPLFKRLIFRLSLLFNLAFRILKIKLGL